MQDLSVLILGSGPNVLEAREWTEHPFDKIVAINNAWAVREDWDDLIYPFDFPEDRRPNALQSHQRFVTQEDFVPVQNEFGGFLYAGGTMAFTAGYWVLGHYKPAHIAFLGCDMHYPKQSQTHFYGTGEADPLRDDVSLRSLEAKSKPVLRPCNGRRLRSNKPVVRSFPTHLSRFVLGRDLPEALKIDARKTQSARKREVELNYFTPSGKYWEEVHRFDPQEIALLDQLWLQAVSA